MPIATRTIQIVIEGVDGPGRACPGPDGVAIGIQRGTEVLEQAPSSCEAPTFRAEVEVATPGEGGEPDVRGPWVHGPKGDRFLYLAWVAIRGGDLVARIKLKLADIDPALLAEAVTGGGTLVARVRLVNRQGKPASGTVRPPDVTWSLAEA